MDEYLYYWDNHGIYCYRGNLADYIEIYGDTYEVWNADEFFDTIGSVDYD